MTSLRAGRRLRATRRTRLRGWLGAALLCASASAARADIAPAALENTAPPAPQDAPLLIACNVDGATIEVDGVAVANVPAAAGRVSIGTHQIVVRAPGFASDSRSLDVGPDGARINVFLRRVGEAPAEAQAALPDAPGRTASTPWYKNWRVWAIVGAGVVAVAGAIAIGVAASGSNGTSPIPVPPIPTGSM